MKRIYAVRVEHIIKLDVMIYVEAENHNDACDAACDFARDNWGKDGFHQRQRLIASEYNTSVGDSTVLEGTGRKVDLSV